MALMATRDVAAKQEIDAAMRDDGDGQNIVTFVCVCVYGVVCVYETIEYYYDFTKWWCALHTLFSVYFVANIFFNGRVSRP